MKIRKNLNFKKIIKENLAHRSSNTECTPGSTVFHLNLESSHNDNFTFNQQN